MSNKTPYEIRLELLQMAKDYLDTVQQVQLSQVQFAKDAFAKAIELQALTVEQTKEQLAKFMPKQYTMEDLMAKANEMYSFVTKKV